MTLQEKTIIIKMLAMIHALVDPDPFPFIQSDGRKNIKADCDALAKELEALP